MGNVLPTYATLEFILTTGITNMKPNNGPAVAVPHNELDAARSVETDRRDRLNYLADMVRELQTMAEREGCATLAGLLWLTQSEAMLQAETLLGKP